MGSYKDILDRIEEPPVWWNEDKVPRWCSFSPEEISDPWARECILLRVECGKCGHPFDVAMSKTNPYYDGSLRELIQNKEIYYGDPPNIGCCEGCISMDAKECEVLEYWNRKVYGPWERNSEFEIVVNDK